MRQPVTLSVRLGDGRCRVKNSKAVDSAHAKSDAGATMPTVDEQRVNATASLARRVLVQEFCGDLLIGGEAIRELSGVLGGDESRRRVGNFEVEANQQSLLELGRPYLLMLAGGESVKVLVKGIHERADARRLVVQFESLD